MTNNIPNTAIELTDKYGEKITSALQVLCDKIGVGMDHFWPIFVKQQVVSGIVGVSSCLFSGLILGLLLLIAGKKWRKWKRDEPNSDGKMVVTSVNVMIFAMVFGFTLIGCVVRYIPCIANPEYYALQEIAKIVKP